MLENYLNLCRFFLFKAKFADFYRFCQFIYILVFKTLTATNKMWRNYHLKSTCVNQYKIEKSYQFYTFFSKTIHISLSIILFIYTTVTVTCKYTSLL